MSNLNEDKGILVIIGIFVVCGLILYFLFPSFVCETEEVLKDGKSQNPRVYDCKKTENGMLILDITKFAFWLIILVLFIFALIFLISMMMAIRN